MPDAKQRSKPRTMAPPAERGLLSDLTPAQRAIVTHGDGPLLVVAGAGTGKTGVLVQRIAWLIRDRRVPPQEILALTFTEKAASEIGQRVDLALPISAFQPWIGTFHGFCEHVLREEALLLGLDPRFRILSAPETWLLLKRNLFRLPLVHYRPLGNPTKFVRTLAEFFREAKDQGITPEALAAYAQGGVGSKTQTTGKESTEYPAGERTPWKELAATYRAYVELQRREGVMDFGDLMLETLRLFREHPTVLAKYRTLFPHVLIDEFQDTNATQSVLLEFLAGRTGNIMVMSDDDQAIFAFRGSHIENVLTFKDRFPGASILSLTDNFRSPQVILDHAYELIRRNNPYRLEATAGVSKRLRSRGGQVWKIPVAKTVAHWHFETEEAEFKGVTEEILRVIDLGAAYRDIAILLRTNAQAADLVPSLLRRDIPHTVAESRGLLARPEVKDALSYFRLLAHPDDGRALFRLLAHAAFSVHPADRAVILAELRRTNGAALPLLKQPTLLAKVSPESRTGISRLDHLLERHLGALRTLRPSTVFLEFLERSGVLKHAIEESAKAPEVLSNFQALLAYIRDLERGLEAGDLLEFQDLLDAAAEGGEGPPAAGLAHDADAVSVLTVHAAKGLEFPFVFVVGATADRYPARGRRRPLELPPELARSSAALLTLEDRAVHVLEERRLFYVALTRAQRRFLITSSASSAGTKLRRKPSPFIAEAGVPTKRQITDGGTPEQQLALPLLTAASPRPILDAARTLSASKIVEYETCPLKYKFKNVLRVPTPPHHALSFGITVHDVLRDLGSAVAAGKRPEITDALKLYEAHWRSEGYESPEHEAARKERGRERLRAYLAAHPEILTRSAIAVEAPFSFPLNTTRLTGRIDRIERLDDGHVMITDFKTGEGRGKESETDIQLSIYALALRKAFQLTPDRLRLSYVEIARDDETTRDQDDDKKTSARAEEIAGRIRSGDFTARPGFHCRFCDFRNICDFAELS